MKNTLYDGYQGPRLPKQVLLNRIQRVMQEEMTDIQRQTLSAYYLQEKTIPQIAEERGVCKSTVSRTLKRAEQKLKRYLRY